MPDPRRSIRSKPPVPATASAAISRQTSTSSTSARLERNTRAISRPDGGNASATPVSSASDGAPSEPDTRRTRHSRRDPASQPAAVDKVADGGTLAIEEAEEDEDNETTRCLCGQQDYPGPPIPLPGYSNRSRARRDAHNMAAKFLEDGPSDDNGALFIQCENCHVWQHGGCVGIFDEAQTPEHYWCEQCKPEYHRLHTGQASRKFSDYQPPAEVPSALRRKQSAQKEPEPVMSPKSLEANAISSATKRRSTMNSRAAWEDEEVLRRVMEESRGDEDAPLATKRRRDESEGDRSHPDVKRQKTDSVDEDEAVQEPQSPLNEDDSDTNTGKNGRRPGSTNKRTKPNATQEQREKEQRDRDKEKERERNEAANRRKGRAEKRNPEASEPPEEPSRASSSTAKAAPRPSRNRSVLDTTAPSDASPTSAPAKKPGRQPARRGKLGRNQYTRDRDDKKDSDSRDSDNVSNGGHADAPNGRGRGRNGTVSRTSLNEMRKRASAMLDFVSRTQVEMATDKTRPSSQEGDAPAETPRKEVNGSKLSSEVRADVHDEGQSKAVENGKGVENGESGKGLGNGVKSEDTIEAKLAAFGHLGTLEMMDVLTRQIHIWQKDHGKQ